ncbi:hypothetical protein CWI80_11785 [Pseudidiomarina sediminum]|uniref:DUF2059 domain-containing protein n=1 Tax=Pseudidiomarina sediminum TaxID=431675 RepID=A0A432YZF4_9GAMM|nr:hypothetical protein [Pseudidiomarina sediminum]MBY6065044.1 hypothetical protein [Pseudidiomarina sediminum]RUO69318.1 hypothetical protein CWI80_11785 [Pseudidiomarina sediminum]
MKTTTALLVLLTLSTPLSVNAAAFNEEVTALERDSYEVSGENQRLVNTYLRMLRYYNKRNFSVTRTVRVLMSNYPHHVEPIMLAALERYPKKYEHIIKAAIDAEPGFTKDVLAVAMYKQVASPSELVRIAVEAEPAYADEIVAEAGKANPTSLEELVRVAVKVEPEMADSIMRSASSSQPEKVEGIVHATLSVLPAIGDYISNSLSDLITFVTGREETDEEVKRQETISILKGAHRAGMDYQELEALAEHHGIAREELAVVVNIEQP